MQWALRREGHAQTLGEPKHRDTPTNQQMCILQQHYTQYTALSVFNTKGGREHFWMNKQQQKVLFHTRPEGEIFLVDVVVSLVFICTDGKRPNNLLPK